MRLYAAPPSPRAFKVLAVARYLDLDYELRPLSLVGGDQLRPEYAALNPNRMMPTLQEDDGFVLWESNAILQYLASKRPDSGLLPADPRGRAEVNRWQFWEMAHWDPACGTILFQRMVKKLLGLGEADAAELEKGEQNVRRFGAVLDGSLAGRRFITGDRLTVADFSVGCWLNYAEAAQYPLDGFAEIRRWYDGLRAMPAWRESIVAVPGR